MRKYALLILLTLGGCKLVPHATSKGPMPLADIVVVSGITHQDYDFVQVETTNRQVLVKVGTQTLNQYEYKIWGNGIEFKRLVLIQLDGSLVIPGTPVAPTGSSYEITLSRT